MEIKDLTLENLMKIGLTPDIIENDLEKWIIENKDILIDFENNKILIGIDNSRNLIANVYELLKNNFLSNGYDIESFNKLELEQREITKKNFEANIKSVPENMRAEFLIDYQMGNQKKLIKIKKMLFNDLKNKILNSDDLFIKKNKPLVISKNEFIQKITKAEILAEETFEVSINQDLFSIEKQKINEEDYNKLKSKYYLDTINSYNSTLNLYKASNDEFAFLNSVADEKLTEDDRIDFIATVLFDHLTKVEAKNNKYNVADNKAIFSQMENIDTLIYETKLLELKADIIKKYINGTDNELKENSVKPNANVNVNISAQKEEVDSLFSSIEANLLKFADAIKNDGYEILVDALYQYFKYDKFPTLTSKIYFKSINKKSVGWALKEIYKSEKRNNLPIEYFQFAQENINLFEDEIIETENFNKSKFYKMFTTNIAK